jgi:stearoyl-CoA desaturase (Delta-9 desaturase)
MIGTTREYVRPAAGTDAARKKWYWPRWFLVNSAPVLWSLLYAVLASALVTQVAVFSTTIYLHRCATHKALELHPAVAFVFRFAIWLTSGLSTREWVAVHRKHHAFTEVEGDPHSPHLHGFWSVQLGNVFHYVREAHNPETVDRYARDIEEDWCDRTIFRVGLLGPTIGTVGLCLILGLWWGLFAAGLHLFMYVFVLSSSINGLCHYIGYRNFDNTATNIKFVALLTGGEGLHNNHHGHPRSPKFSFRPREIDPSWPLIKLLIGLRLARPYKTIEEIQAN